MYRKVTLRIRFSYETIFSLKKSMLCFLIKLLKSVSKEFFYFDYNNFKIIMSCCKVKKSNNSKFSDFLKKFLKEKSNPNFRN
jgi:hypothetical protein